MQTIQREGTILREDMIETGKLRNKEISSIRRMHSEAQSEAKNIIAGLENDIKQAREREEIKGKRVGHLRKELKLLTGKIDLLHAELDQTSKDLKLANHRLEIARMDQKETRILYEKKLLEMASEANEKAQGMAMDYGVRLSRLELDVKQEKIRRNECEEIATAAVEAAEAKAETLEVSLKESTKKRLRLEAHVKLQLMLLSTLLSRELE